MFKEAFLAAAFFAWCHVFSAQGMEVLPRPLDVSVYAIIDDSYVNLLGNARLAAQFLEAAMNGATLQYAGGFRNVYIRLLLTSLAAVGPRREAFFMKLRGDGNLDGEHSLKVFGKQAEVVHQEEQTKTHTRTFTKDVVLLVTGRAICALPGDNGRCKVVKGIAAPRSLCTNSSAAIVTFTRDIQEATDRVARYMAKVMGADVQDTRECSCKEDSIFDELVEDDMITYLRTIDRSCLPRHKNPAYFLTPGSLFHQDGFCEAKLPGRPGINYCGADEDINSCQVHCCSPGKSLTEVYSAPDGTPCDAFSRIVLTGTATWSNSTDFLNARLCYRGRCTATATDLQYILKTDRKNFDW
ncbi:uncharacterized protein LOC135393402 [Ornithodoros turicata]|uniref:uncharacterized protein LOC135393402 n=1 Tax=Ornithodoros turicata TaxID=34597 RepID=UPI003138EFAD